MCGFRTLRAVGLVATFLAAPGVVADVITVPGDYATIAGAIDAAAPWDTIQVQQNMFGSEPLIDYAGKPITIRSTGSLTQPSAGLYLLAADAMLQAVSGQLQIAGELRSPNAGFADVLSADSFQVNGSGRLVVQSNCDFSVTASYEIRNDGVIIVRPSAQLLLSVPAYGTFRHYGSLNMQDGADLTVTGDLLVSGPFTATNADIWAAGELTVDNVLMVVDGGSVTVHDRMWIQWDATMMLNSAVLTVSGWQADVWGTLRIFDGTVFAQRIDISNNPTGEVSLHRTWLVADMLANASSLSGSGAWYTDFDNQRTAVILDDTTIVGDVHNYVTGLIHVMNGAVTLLGTLNNEGQIIGDFGGRERDGGEPVFRVGGDWIGGPSSAIGLPGMLLSVGGNLRWQMQDSASVDLRDSTVACATQAGSTVEVEVLSRDIGPSPLGLDRTRPGHYPLGTLHVERGTARLADAFVNAPPGERTAEAVYAETLRIGPGATLDTNGLAVYYADLINEGTVIGPNNLHAITPLLAGDLDCDGVLGFDDIDPFIVALEGQAVYESTYPDCEYMNADCNLDGNVDFDDIDAFVALLGG